MTSDERSLTAPCLPSLGESCGSCHRCTPGPSTTLDQVLAEVADERASQDAKWGEQNHPDGTGYAYLRRKADLARRQCDAAFAAGHGSWRLILREEYHEALACTDEQQLRAELVQVAAVAASWIQAIDRRTTTHEETTR